MRPLFLLLFALVATTGFAQQTINDANAEPRTIGSFHALEVSNAFEVVLTQGAEALAVSANDKEDLAQIRTTVDNGVLKIWFESKGKWWPKTRKLRAYVSAKNLDRLSVSGATQLRISGGFNATALRLDCSGASEVDGKLTVSDELEIRLSGASDVDVSGSASEVAIRASGASRVKATGFSTGTCDIRASGASKVHIGVDKELKADLSGASTVIYSGSAVIRDIKTSGASSISKKS